MTTPDNFEVKLLHWRTIDAKENLTDGTLEELDVLLRGIRNELKTFRKEEERLMIRMVEELQKTERLLDSSNFQRYFDQSLVRINADIDRTQRNAHQLTTSLDTLSGLAENISSRVATLDLGKSRLVECLQLVNDMKDLGTCASGVQEAIAAENYEEAARNIHRFLTLDSAVFKMGDNPKTKDAGYSVKNCYEVLRQATIELKKIIEDKFDEAKNKNDVAMMEHFFKLFPLINEHRNGLQRFGAHLCDKITSLGEYNYKIMQAGGTNDNRRNVIFADTLTMIFEGIAQIIELNQPIISNFYGQEKLLDLIEIIQLECDKQTSKVLDAFIERRRFEEKARQVYDFIRNQYEGDKDKIDAIELDVLLSEVTLMHTRAELFWRFLRRRLDRSDIFKIDEGSINCSHIEDEKIDAIHKREILKKDETFKNGNEFENDYQRQIFLERLKKNREERATKLDAVLNRSGLNTRMQELLGKYVLMEQYYMTQSVQKAILIDTVEDGLLTSSLLDDVFFIVRKSIRRSISSSSVDCICAMLNNSVTVLETDFLKYICAPIKSGYPSMGWTAEAYQTAQSAYSVVLQQGKGGGASEFASTEKQRALFLVALNNLRVSNKCLCTLKSGLEEDFQKHLNQISSFEKRKLENARSQLDDFSKRLEQHANLGIAKLCESAFRPKLKASIDEYLELPHILEEEQLMEFELNNPFMAKFILQLDKHIFQFEPLLVPENFQTLVCLVSREVINQFERMVFKCSFNRLGVVQLDKEFRELTSYLTSVAGWDVRENFTRLSQIITLLNSESLDGAVALLEQFQGSSIFPSDFLTHNDIRRTLNLRDEFERDQINAKLNTLKS